jgi:hypothetical protein
MWPFPAKIQEKGAEKDPRTIESRMRALELDWEDTYERIRKVLQRISKRAEFVEKHERESEPNEPGGAPATSSHPAPPGVFAGRLNDRQREIQQQILRRRAGG